MKGSSVGTSLVLWVLCACSSTNPNGMDSGPPPNDAGGGDSPTMGHAWTQVMPMDGMNGSAQTVTGFFFDSMSDGVVSFGEGLIEHFSSPTTIDSITLDGSGMLPGPNDDQYFGFLPGTSLGLVVRNFDATQLVTSQDNGKTWKYEASFKSASAPSGVMQDFPLLWAGTDKSNAWHVAVAASGGDVYSSSGVLGPNATLTDTWHPVGVVTVPATIPSGDCTDFVSSSTDPGHYFSVTTDGSVFLYASTDAMCRSTDSGHTFVDVSANIMPSSFTSHNPPLGFLFTSATAGIAYYGSELDNPGTAYVLYSSDGGDNWTVATLPAAAMTNSISLNMAFASPSGSLFLVGGGNGLVLFKSTDGVHTWMDISANIASFASAMGGSAPVRLVAGYAFDDQHIWVGSDDGFIAYTATGGQ